MYPTWWRKLRYAHLSTAQVLAYESLRILEAARGIAESKGRMTKSLLAAHIREIGNAVIDMSYSNRSFIIEFLGSRELFESVCATRHFLAHDEAAIPVARMTDFLKIIPMLEKLARRILAEDFVAEQIPFARSHLEELEDGIIEFDPKILGRMPYGGKSRDHVALCYAVMVKDIEWRHEKPVSSAIDFMTRLDLVLGIDEDLAAACRNLPFGKMARLKKTIAGPGAQGDAAALDFMGNGAGNCIGNLKAFLKGERHVMDLAREFSDWIGKNRKSFIQSREAFCRRWLAENGLMEPSVDDAHMALVAANARM